jgi:hypothetical protein
MAQLFTPACNTLARLAVPVLVLAVLGVMTAMVLAQRTDWKTDAHLSRPQPVPFSHRHHAGELGIDCRFCHVRVASDAAASLPPAAICMKCHSQVWTDAAVLEPVRASWREGTPLRWSRLYDLPDFVYFNHSIHVQKGIACSNCHGEIEDMAQTAKAVPLHMGWCLHCHEHPPASDRAATEVAAARLLDCTVCHR